MDLESQGNYKLTPPQENKESMKELINSINEQLESLRSQYENQLDSLRTEIDRSRRQRDSKENDGSGGAGQSPDKHRQLDQLKEELGRSLPADKQGQLEKLMSNIDQEYQAQLEDMQRQHVDDVDVQVKAMRCTLEEIYHSQLTMVRSEMEQSHQTAILDLQEMLDKDHKEEINRLEQEWTNKLEDLKQDYERELRESQLGQSIGKEESEAFISKLNKKLTEEHKQIIQKLEADLERSELAIHHHHSQDSQTEGDETASVASAPVTEAKQQGLEEKQAVLSKADEAQKSLEVQLEEINALRAQMLGEYEQMLSVRAEVMASQSEEVGKLQQEMAQIQRQYEDQMANFQEKVKAQTESALKSSHEKELADMKLYYEGKVTEMEESYTTDIAQLKQEHAELIARLQQESGTSVDIPSPEQLPSGKHREYVRRTTMLTAISDEEESFYASPPSGNEVLEGRIKVLEEKLKEKEKIVGELKKRLEAEATSAEDLHGKLLDSNKTLEDFEESLKSKAQEIEELKQALTDKDNKISDLESEKAALEEKGEKDKTSTEGDDSKVIQELKERIKKLEAELSASKETNVRIQEEMNQLDSQHGEAIMKLKEEMESLNKLKIEEIEAGFQIQLEEELKQQAEELDNKYRDELDKQNEELEIYKRSESELKQQLDTLQSEHEKQLDELKEKYELEREKSFDVEPDVEVREVMETQLASPTETVDRDSLEAAIRENVRAEILQEYEESIDKLKSDYEERISELNDRIQSFETLDAEKTEVSEREKDLTDSQELDLRESLKAELALEFKEKLQTVTDEYESKLTKLQNIVDSRKEVKSSGAPYALARSRSLDILTSKEKEKPKLPTEYEGYVATIRREYEEKIKSLQMQIAQYRSTSGSVPSSPSRRMEQGLVGDGMRRPSPDAGLEIPIKTELGTPELRQEIYDEIAKEFELSFKGLSAEYEKKLTELTAKLELLQSDSATQGSYENKIREEYEEKIAKLKEEHQKQISDLKTEYENEIQKLNEDVEKAKSEKIAAEKKVKADMFVWHEEMMREQKTKHEKYESQLRKEYEEKMDLYRDELQENFEAEKDRILQEHKQELINLEDRYENLVEGLRTGEVPEVAEMVQQKYDMELEMAKTLIQQECDETIEAEQTRLTEQFEKQIEDIIAEREKELTEQREQYEREITELRSSLLEQYESQLIEAESKHKSAMQKLKAHYETMILDSDQTKSVPLLEESEADIVVQEKVKPVTAQPSKESVVSEEGETEEEPERVMLPDSTSDATDKDKDDDDKGDGKGGDKSGPTPSQSADTVDNHEQEQSGDRDADVPDETDGAGTEVEETMVQTVVKTVHTGRPVTATGAADSHTDLVQQLRKELQEKVEEYESSIEAMKEAHALEIQELEADLARLQSGHEQKMAELEDSHEQAVRQYQETIDRLKQGESDGDDNEALELAHQQELQDLEERLVEKHMNELNNLETQHQSRLDELEEKYQTEIEQLQEELTEARRALEQYPDVLTPEQTVPQFRAGSTMGSTKDTEDFMVPTHDSQSDSDKSESQTLPKTETMETQQFSARSGEDRSAEISQGEDDSPLQDTMDEMAVQSLDDTSMDQSRGTLRGVDTTQDTELIQFSEEDEETDKSIEEDTETQRTDRSTPTALLQTLGYGAEIPGGPTVKSLDDTTDSSIRASDREEMVIRIRELESEVEDLRHRLKGELSKQDEQMERLDREKSEESNLVAMLRGDIERLNSDRDALQSTNEHLLGLLSDAVKTYMGVEESITKKMKSMMDKSGVKGRPGSAERKRTPPPSKKLSPATSPGRLSPGRAEDGDAEDTSIVSNVTDEGLDLSQRIADSIFQGPELASEEEELLTDSGSRLRSSVTHLLDMMEETTNQLLETRQTQVQMMETLEGKGHDLEQLTSRCNDLEERLKEEVERKDFLVLELHKAEGLIEGYSSERESLDQRIQELEEHKETLVLELETTKNKLLDLESIQTENKRLRQEMTEQQELMSGNVGAEAQALLLEVTRLNSENREKDEQIKQVHERFESRVRELESSGEDMETHFGKLVDEKKQEVADLHLQVEALEKQLKAKKQFLEEQSAEREQEHEEYQKQLDHWKKMVQDLEKQNGAGSRLQREIDDLTEQLQTRIDQHNQALLDAERYQRESQDKDLSLNELKTIIQQLEQDLQDRTQQLDNTTQKVKQLEEELSRRLELEDELSASTKSDVQSPKPGSSLEFDGTSELKRERAAPQMTVEEEMRQAADKTKEELVREKFTLQTQVNEHLVQISSLRNQLDDMRHRRGIDVPETVRTLEFEREKSQEKDKEIAELKLQIEELGEKIDNRDQQIEQLRDQRDRGKMGRGSPIEGMIEFESDREMEKQIEALKKENKQLRERVKLSETSSVTDISGLSQNLLEEKNQEIDDLSEQILRLQSDFNDLKAEKGVQNLFEEIEELQAELKHKDEQIAEAQSVRVSQAFTDHSLTPDSSLMNVGASFSEKASIQQEMEESVARGMEKMASLESEVTALRAALHAKEEHLVNLETELSTLREDLQGKDEMILALQTKPVHEELLEGMPEDPGLLQAMIQEKEDLITQLTVQVDSLQAEVDNLSDFQNKLQEDFDTVQAMLEEKDREIESLTKELTDRSPTHTDEHSLVIKHEVEIARLKKELREKDNVVEEKMEEIAEITDKVELLETHISQYKTQVKGYDETVLTLERELKKTKKQLDAAIQGSSAALTADEKDKIIAEKTREIERLNVEVEAAMFGRPPSPPLSQDEKSQLIAEQKEEIDSLKLQIQKLLGRPPTPPESDDEKSAKIAELKNQIVSLTTQLEAVSLGQPPSPPGEEGESSLDVVLKLRTEIDNLKQQIMDANLTEDDKFVLIRDLRLENETLRKQIDAALKIRPPSPPLDEDEKTELIKEQKKEIQVLRTELETVSKIGSVAERSEDEKDKVIIKQEKEIMKLKRQVDEALQITPPPPPVAEDEKETEIIRLTTELTRVTEAVKNGEERKLVKEKTEESLKLKAELDKVKQKLESLSVTSLESVIIEKEQEIEKKDRELRKAKESVKKLEEELQSAKEVRAYEDEIELKEKEDEIEELQAELQNYRSRTDSMLAQGDLEMSLNGDGGRRDSAELTRSLSFFKEQYEEKCAESRQLQVQLDLVKDQLEKARSDRLEDAQEEIEIFKAELERKAESKTTVLQNEKETIEKELKEIKQELVVNKERLHQTSDERVKSIEAELQLTKDELAKERKDNVQTINDMEKLRERKEKERRGSLKTIQELEHDLEEKVTKEKELNTQIKQLNEELVLIKKQYGIEDKSVGSESRTSPKSVELRSQGSFELGNDIETLQQQVLQYKQHADKAKEILAEKQKYQSQVVKLEIQQEQLQKKMNKEVGQLEEQLKAYAKQPDFDVWTQLHATQERLEKTTEKLQETNERLSETERNLQKISSELSSREADMRDLQQDLWKTSGQLSVTSGKLQETEEKLRQTIAQVSEREEQIHQLQGELQHVQQEAEQVSKKAKEAPEIKPGELDKLRKQLKSSQTEVEALKKSLNEAVEMSEQQLQMVENKDQEYIKLKLDIQQTLAEKEKTIKEQRNKLKEKEQEVTKTKQEAKEKEKEIQKVRQEVEQQKAAAKQQESSESAAEVAALRAQLQNQEEVILNLESNLREARVAVKDREKEIDNIHQTNRKDKDAHKETIQSLQNQIRELQHELDELRAAINAQGQRSRSPDRFGREESPYDQNGRAVSGRADRSYRSAGRTNIDHSDGQALDDQEDSGHQSFGQQTRDPLYGPEGQSLSPRDRRAHVRDQDVVEEIQRSVRGQVYSTPSVSEPGSEHGEQTRQSGSRPGSEDLTHRSPSGSRPESGGSDSSSHRSGTRGSGRYTPPNVQEVTTPAYSPPTRDRPHSQASNRSPGQDSPRSSQRSSPSVLSPEQTRDKKSSRSTPTEVHEHLTQVEMTSGIGFPADLPTEKRMDRSPRSSFTENDEEFDRMSRDSAHSHFSHKGQGPASSRSSRKASPDQHRRDGESSSPRRKSPPFDGDGEDKRGCSHDRAERQAVGASFTIDEVRRVYPTRSTRTYDETERYVGEDGQLYDRDGNIRPKYNSHEARSQRAQERDDLASQGEGQPQDEGQGVSSEAERYIQQLRRELLITKTALMQIQRGERLDGDAVTEDDFASIATEARLGQGDRMSPERKHHKRLAEAAYDTTPSEEDLNRLRRRLEKAEEELALFRSSSDLSARDFVQKVMSLKDELASEHQRHIHEMSTRAQQDTETQLATMRIKYTDEIEHIKKRHSTELEERLRDLKQKLERKHKSETNKLVLKHQEEVGVLKLRAGADMDETSVYERHQRQRQDGVGADHGVVNGHTEPMSEKLQGILRRLHSEGVQVLTISELEYLSRNQSQSGLPEAGIESVRAGWENERQSMLSTIQSLKDLLSQTHKLRGLDKSLEGSDWRAELLRAIGYVFTKERESLLAELRSHVLSYPSTSLDETQRLEQKIRNLEAHHHAALEQIFSADRQSMLAEIRDLRAHATIARMHQQEERDRMNEKVNHTEDTALKKERQLKREDSDDESTSEYAVQLLEFKIQQEKVLQEDLRTSLDSERNRTSDLSSLLNQEKTSKLDLQTTISALQNQVAKLREGLEREQSRYVSVTNALEEEKSKSLNLSDLLESERETLWRVQAELETLKQQQAYTDPRAVEQLQFEVTAERERRCQVESQREVDMVTMENMRQEVEMGRRHQQAMEVELNAKISQLQRTVDMERQKQSELNRALERERSLSAHLQQTLDAEKSNSERLSHHDQSTLEDLQIKLETERANLDDLNRALQREQKAREEVESEKNLLKDHLNQERALNEDLKHDLDKLQFERLEAVNKLQKERDMLARLKSERDQVTEDLRKVKSLEIQRDQDREADRMANKKSVREAEREKEEYRMKLHEQELETQRLSQKIRGLEDQLAESQENELKAIRELEKLKLDHMTPSHTATAETMSAQTSPRPDVSDGMSQNGHMESCSVYRSQLESMCQSLHYLILRCREQLSKATYSSSRPVSVADFDALQNSLRDLLAEVKQLQEMEGDYMDHPSGSINERILRQNEELTNFVARISEEKTELRNMLTRLEEEIWRYRQMDAKYQEMQRSSSGVDHQLIAERSERAKEKLSLQMALNAAEREINLLQTDLRVERERRVASGITDTKDTDKIKIQRLYGKYLRAESFRKALIYQKKYLLLLLGGFQDTEETTLVLLSRMGAVDSHRQSVPRYRSKPLTTFRGAVRVIIAIQRMRFLVKKWRRATRVGSEVVGGSMDQTNGYVPHSNGFAPPSPPRPGTSPRPSAIPVRSSASPVAWMSSHRQPSVSRSADNATFLSPRYDVDSFSSSSFTSPRVTTTSHVPSTPPTKDYSSTTRYTSPSSGARRKILTSTSIPAQRPGRVRFTSEDSPASSLGESDDYINRLENLQTRLGTLQSGRRSNIRQAWR